jgi:hypothetical protein
MRQHLHREIDAFAGLRIPHALNAQARQSPHLISRHLHRRLLTADTRIGTTPVFESAEAELVDDDVGSCVTIRPQHTVAFLFACTRAALALRLWSLEHVIASVRGRKAGSQQRDIAFDRARNSELVAIFNRLSPLVFSQNNNPNNNPNNNQDAGLFSSLALIEFLALHKCFPTWVWGVTTGPSCVHCWVQQDGWVFNGPVEYVLRYTPILAV